MSEFKNLTILNIAETNIDNRLIKKMIDVSSLRYLYLSFTNLSAAIAVQVAQFLLKFELLDACKVYFSLKYVKVVASFCKFDIFTHISEIKGRCEKVF